MENNKRVRVEETTGYHEGTYIPSKEDLCTLIMKDDVSISVVEMTKYTDGKEKLKVVILHK